MNLSRTACGVVAIGCALVIGNAGCRSKPPSEVKGSSIESLKPEAPGAEGDIKLGERFEDGFLVKDGPTETVYFSYDSFQVDNAEMPKVEAVAAYMKNNPTVKLVAEGNCDERGSNEYNMSLGEHRALGVRAHMVRLGIDGARIQTRSYGEEKPAVEGHDEATWKMNRRVEFKLYK